MMLRASSEANGQTVDLHAVVDGARTTSGVAGEAELLALVEAALTEDQASALPQVRDRVAGQLGPAALVDAAAVIGNFQRMTRIADGTGIPLDDAVAAMTVDIREDLGLNAFGSAQYTPRVGLVKRLLVRLLGPLVMRRMRRRPASS